MQQNLRISVDGDSILIDNGTGINLNDIKDTDWYIDTLTGNMFNMNTGKVGIFQLQTFMCFLVIVVS